MKEGFKLICAALLAFALFLVLAIGEAAAPIVGISVGLAAVFAPNRERRTRA